MRKIVLLLLLLSGMAACSPAAPPPPSATKSAVDTVIEPKKLPDRPNVKVVQRYDGPAEID